MTEPTQHTGVEFNTRVFKERGKFIAAVSEHKPYRYERLVYRGVFSNRATAKDAARAACTAIANTGGHP